MNWRGARAIVFKKLKIRPKRINEPPLNKAMRALKSINVTRTEAAKIIRITRRVIKKHKNAKAMHVSFKVGTNLQIKQAEKEVDQILGKKRGNKFWARTNDPYF